MTAETARGKGLISAEDGRLGLEFHNAGVGQRIYFSELSFSSGLLRSLPSLPWGNGFAADKKVLRFEGAAFYLQREGSAQRLHILHLSSALLELRGSVCWEAGHLQKASLAGILPAVLADRLPQSIRRRLSSAPGGKKMIKCAYNNNRLTFYGASGPLLQAAWTPD